MSHPATDRRPLATAAPFGRLGAGLLLLLGAFGLGACAREPKAEAPPRIRNLVVVLVDTLRADHLPLYGYERPTTPNLDRLAASAGVVFEDARSQAPCTFPSANSILTSRSTTYFLASLTKSGFAIPDEVPSIARRLSEHGFSTAAVSASPIVRATPSDENKAAGFGAGFDSFDEFCKWREAGCVLGRAEKRFAELEEPFFLYLHFMEPHDPYRPQPFPGGAHPFAADEPQGPDKEWVRLGDPRPIASFLYSKGKDPGYTEADLRHLVDLYDEEILYWDSEMIRIFDQLEKRGALESTAIAIVSDHGEEFLEHGHVKHCRTLFDSEIRVPFVLFVPGRGPLRIPEPVSNLDLVPTLLDLVGVPVPEGELEGRSLLPLLAGAGVDAPPHPQFSAYGKLRGVVDGDLKLVRNITTGEVQIYDLAHDPGELHNLAAEPPAGARRLRDLLAEWRARTEPALAEKHADEAEKQLRAVGYLD